MISKRQEAEMIAQTKLIVNEFLKTNASDKELADLLGISSSTIQRRLTNKERIVSSFGNEGLKIYELVTKNRKLNQKNGKILGGLTSRLNNGLTTPKLRLDLFFKDKKQQLNFIFHIALTYRAKLPLILELFDTNETRINTFLREKGEVFYIAYNYLQYNDITNQNIVRENILNYYKELLDAKRKGNKMLLTEKIREVTDFKIKAIILKYKNNSDTVTLDDNEVETLIKYQLKYALSQRNISDFIGINYNSFRSRVKIYFEKNKKFSSEYERLMDYNLNKLETDIRNAKRR